MGLPAKFALIHSEYNGFLFATVGVENNGMPLTVLSVLTRHGVDPWREAERLAALRKETATRALAAIVAALPDGSWKGLDAEAVACRLVDCLPDRSMPIGSVPSRSPHTQRSVAWLAAVWVCRIMIACLVVLPIGYLQSDPIRLRRLAVRLRRLFDVSNSRQH
jgi:hypothetical protein